MSIKKIPFSPPDITESEVNLVSEALRSGWITTGPKTKEFERLDCSCAAKRIKLYVLNSATACMESDIAGFGRRARRRGDNFRLYLYRYRKCNLPCGS